MQLDDYVCDALMRDLVGHSRSPSAFLTYLYLYRQTLGSGRSSAALSYSVLADSIGISKRAVQDAIDHLVERRLLRRNRRRPTDVPVYTILTPWARRPRA